MVQRGATRSAAPRRSAVDTEPNVAQSRLSKVVHVPATPFRRVDASEPHPPAVRTVTLTVMRTNEEGQWRSNDAGSTRYGAEAAARGPALEAWKLRGKPRW
ncbi:hypothetical protein PCL_10245 [Purpureocillium lilacinum]|uniref:Uncharacterized protein n=1 Tax=Purpureocillium lilacinum TaxID=33203 RepID=A0A2U3EFL0_PURLI|nr:hypothetical protein PCL_10245 [Purpureocillium lilacinum]